MARINSAYDLLRDPVRRARYDASPAARRRQDAESGPRNGARAPGMDERGTAAAGPPPAPRTRPVTARYDTTTTYHRRNTTITRGRTPLPGHPPVGRRRGEMDLRASIPTGPVERRTDGPRPRLPSLESARSTSLDFGRFHGHTLGEVADLEPTYIDWIARTITRDRDLVVRARVIQADLDERGVERSVGSTGPARADMRGRPGDAEAFRAG
jgi:curved DNA-binding protein CbpA